MSPDPDQPITAFVPVKGPVNRTNSASNENEEAEITNIEDDKDLPLNEQIEELHGVIGDIVAVIKEIHSEVQKKCSVLEKDVASLKEKLNDEEEASCRKLSDERNRVAVMEQQIKEAQRVELSLRKEVGGLASKLITLCTCTGKDFK